MTQTKSIRYTHALAGTIAAALATAVPTFAQTVPTPPTTLPSPLSLPDAIKIALAHQPSRYVADTQITSAQGGIEQSRSLYFPTVTPSYTYVENSSNAGALSSPNGGTTAVTITGTIFDNGKREVENAQARRVLDEARFSDRDTKQQIIDTVTRDYYALLKAIDLLTVAQSQVTSAQTVVNQVTAQINAGTAAAASVYQAQATLANDQVSLLTDQAGVTTASAQLKNDIGVDTTTDVVPVPLSAGPGTLPPPPSPEAPKSLDDYLKVAYANREDLKSDQAAVAHGEEGVRLAQLNAAPQITGTYEEAYQNTPGSELSGAGWDGKAVLTASWNVFDGGFNQGAIKIARATRDQARDTLVSDENNVHLMVEQDVANRSQSLNSASLAETALQAAQVNYDSAVAEQKEGLLTVVDVVTAEATLAQAQDNYVATIYTFYIADADLQRALGVNDIAPAQSPVPPTAPSTNAAPLVLPPAAGVTTPATPAAIPAPATSTASP